MEALNIIRDSSRTRGPHLFDCEPINVTMNVREKLGENRMGFGAAVALILVAGSVFAYNFWPRGPRVHPYDAFYTDDDGKTFYRSDIYNFPPYDHDGKTATWAKVYEDDDGNRFVGYCLRFKPETQKFLQGKYQEARNSGSPEEVLTIMSTPNILVSGMEAKLPGDNHSWVPRGRMMQPLIKSPSGGNAYPVNP